MFPCSDFTKINFCLHFNKFNLIKPREHLFYFSNSFFPPIAKRTAPNKSTSTGRTIFQRKFVLSENKHTFVAVGIIQIRFLTEFDELKNKTT